LCVVVHVWEATRVVGHYTMVVPGYSSWAGRVWEATDVGWRLRVVLAEASGVVSVGYAYMAGGGHWDFKRGRVRRRARWRTRSFASDRYQTSPQG